MARNYWCRMFKGASGPKLEHKALDAGREYPLTEATVRQLEFPELNLTGLDDRAAKEQKDARAEKEKRFAKGGPFRGDVLEVLKELTDADLERIKEQQEEAKKKA